MALMVEVTKMDSNLAVGDVASSLSMKPRCVLSPAKKSVIGMSTEIHFLLSSAPIGFVNSKYLHDYKNDQGSPSNLFPTDIPDKIHFHILHHELSNIVSISCSFISGVPPAFDAVMAPTAHANLRQFALI